MLILLTNDDGIQAPGIVAMYRELVRLGEVRVVAPETVQSAKGHGIKISAPLLTNRVTVENAFTGIAVDGRPADCVRLAIAKLLPRPPDLVVSGMNQGTNVGINVIYSGTVAAAIEAAFLGLPSIAVSLLLKNDVPIDHARGAVLAREAIELVLKAGLKAGQVVNINIPALRAGESPAGISFVRQCTRPWVDTYEQRKDPRGRDYFWNSSVFKLGETEDDTDVAALRDNYITITPLQFDLTDHAMLKQMEHAATKYLKPSAPAKHSDARGNEESLTQPTKG
jgi:5'-nucleotidase